jgi:dolichol-phosphate mannosyltransferase
MADQLSASNYFLSVVVPVFNEELVIGECVKRLTEVLDGMGCRYEIIFVNDGSQDSTLALLREERARNKSICIVNLSRNFGHQIAITAGMDRARGDATIIIDADLQDPPELFPALVERWQEGFEIVHARRRVRAGESTFKRWTASIFYRLMKNLSNIDIPVDVGDFRLLSKRALMSFRQLKERHRYVRGLIAWLGYKQGFVEYDREQRFAGETKYSLRKMLRFSFDGISSFSILPLRMASGAGVLCAIAGAFYVLYALYIKLVLNQAVIGWTSMIIAVLLIGGIQLICLGIIGEYIGILHEEVKGRPLYFVNDEDYFDNQEIDAPTYGEFDPRNEDRVPISAGINNTVSSEKAAGPD